MLSKNGEKRKFDHNAFTQLVEKLNIYQWPRTEGGSYMTDKDTLRRFDRYPEIKLIKEAQNLKKFYQAEGPAYRQTRRQG